MPEIREKEPGHPEEIRKCKFITYSMLIDCKNEWVEATHFWVKMSATHIMGIINGNNGHSNQ
jgi:hypothetical protein